MADAAPEPRCQHEGCAEPGMLCTYTFAEDEQGEWQDEFFCPAHAPGHGYCAGCGNFWAGITTFEVSGYCEHCLAEIEADRDDGNDTEDYYDDIYP
jgi:hypothetical protein